MNFTICEKCYRTIDSVVIAVFPEIDIYALQIEGVPNVGGNHCLGVLVDKGMVDETIDEIKSISFKHYNGVYKISHADFKSNLMERYSNVAITNQSCPYWFEHMIYDLNKDAQDDEL